MSALTTIKNVTLIYLDKNAPAEIKQSLLKLINAVETDLEIEGYEQSSDVDVAISELDQALISLDEKEEEDAIVVTRVKRGHGYQDDEEEGDS